MSRGTAIGLRIPTTALPWPRTTPDEVRPTPKAPGICCSRRRAVRRSISSRTSVATSVGTVVRKEASASSRTLWASPPNATRSCSSSSSDISTTVYLIGTPEA